jgi:hypothetical protein
LLFIEPLPNGTVEKVFFNHKGHKVFSQRSQSAEI